VVAPDFPSLKEINVFIRHFRYLLQTLSNCTLLSSLFSCVLSNASEKDENMLVWNCIRITTLF